MNTISLLDLPSEILENIILQVNDPKDILLHPFLNITRKGSTVCIQPSKCIPLEPVKCVCLP